MPTDYQNTISFPGLGFDCNPGQSLEIFGLSFRFYGLMIGIGLILAILYGYKRCKAFGHNFDHIVDGILFIVPMAVIGARLYYCIFQWEQYAANPISILYIWEGGLAIYGGVIFAALGILIYCKWKKVTLGSTFDLTALGFLIGQSVGRWGNFFNREAFGAETDTFLRMGLYQAITENGDIISSNTMHYYHPTFLYESLWNLVGFILLHFLSKRRKYDGQIALGYVAWYGLGRTLIEGLRTDSLYWGPFRVSQMLALISFMVAACLLLINAFRSHDPAKMQVNITKARLAAAEADDATYVDEENCEEDDAHEKRENEEDEENAEESADSEQASSEE